MVARSACTLALLLGLLAPAVRADEDKDKGPRKNEPKSTTILLVTDAGVREYQFLRTLLIRQMEKKSVDLAIHLQHANAPRVADVIPERVLRNFPDVLKPLKDATKPTEGDYDNLARYNLMVAFDVNWAKLDADVLKNVRKWVEDGGALVFVAGPVNTATLAAAAGDGKKKIQPILDVLPVVPGKGDGHAFEKPRRLRFTKEADEAPFLRLDKDKPLSVWNEFFGEGPKDETGTERGFFSVYPVESVKDKAKVLAHFSDPRLPRKKNGGDPYLVTMPVGRGKAIYIGSGEMWRLREYSEAYHERFWTELAKWATSPPAEKEKTKSDGAAYSGEMRHDYQLIEARIISKLVAIERRLGELQERQALERIRVHPRIRMLEDELLRGLEPPNNNTIRR